MSNVIFTVTNDVFTDQRVNKMAKTLSEMGYRPVIIGVKRRDSQAFHPPYARVRRIPLLFQKGFFFYAEYNLKLFFVLLFSRFGLVVANDLDTLLPAHLAARIRMKPLVYDTHEYFTGTPEVMDRPGVYRVWKALERWLFPRQKTIITVNQSIAGLYEQEYKKRLHVVRNLPPALKLSHSLSRQDLNVPPETRILLLQGSGINVERGAEELVAAMRPAYGLERVQLWIIGGGDVLPVLKAMVADDGMDERIRFFQKMPYQQLMAHTALADIGLSLDKDRSINYRFSLPNKLFDYIMAGVPVLASDLTEVKKVILEYGVGQVLPDHAPPTIARTIRQMLADDAQMKKWKSNCLQARKTLCWEQEEKIVQEIYAAF
jgi:glycosyltransferase involved in cell wall biosynthesis